MTFYNPYSTRLLIDRMAWWAKFAGGITLGCVFIFVSLCISQGLF